jgi:hypothetical protein
MFKSSVADITARMKELVVRKESREEVHRKQRR